MIYNTTNRSNYTTESQKEKKTCINAHAGGKWNLNSNIYKQIWKVYVLGINVVIKNLSYVKSVRVELIYMQYNISDSEALLSCSVFTILEMASLDILFVCSARQQAWLCS